MGYHEPRLQRGDPTDGPLETVMVYVDDNNKAFFPGDDGYVEPSPESAEFLSDYAQQLKEDAERIESGQDQQFSAQQRENTVKEMERITGGQQFNAGQETTLTTELQEPQGEVQRQDPNAPVNNPNQPPPA